MFKLTKLERMYIYDCISVHDDFGMFECFISFTFQNIALHIKVLNCTNKQQLWMYWCHWLRILLTVFKQKLKQIITVFSNALNVSISQLYTTKLLSIYFFYYSNCVITLLIIVYSNPHYYNKYFISYDETSNKKFQQ